MLQEDKGTTYIRQRNDGSDRKDSFVQVLQIIHRRMLMRSIPEVLKIRFHIPVILMEVLPIQWDIL